jgi:GGDEF domain-containing protein
LSSIIGIFCLIVYVGALGYGAYRTYRNIYVQHNSSEKEFYELVATANAAGALGFMNQGFQDAVRDSIMNSKTLQGAVISGPYGNEYAVERKEGIITWTNDIPRFSTRFGLSRDPHWEKLNIDGIRNATISAVYYIIDYNEFSLILKHTLMIVLASLTLALLTMIFGALFGKPPTPRVINVAMGDARSFKFAESAAATEKQAQVPEGKKTSRRDTPQKEAPGFEAPGQAAFTGNPADGKQGGENPKGLYSPHGNISWEAYTKERLASELHRCAAFEQDLVFIAMEFDHLENSADLFFNEFAEMAVKHFTLRDLIFEWGSQGIAIIIPNADLDQGLARSEEFHAKVLSHFAARFSAGAGLAVGLSSRAGRLIDAERLIFETSQALVKAKQDPSSSLVAFRSDPEKYRAFIAAQGRE